MLAGLEDWRDCLDANRGRLLRSNTRECWLWLRIPTFVCHVGASGRMLEMGDAHDEWRRGWLLNPTNTAPIFSHSGKLGNQTTRWSSWIWVYWHRVCFLQITQLLKILGLVGFQRSAIWTDESRYCRSYEDAFLSVDLLLGMCHRFR